MGADGSAEPDPGVSYAPEIHVSTADAHLSRVKLLRDRMPVRELHSCGLFHVADWNKPMKLCRLKTFLVLLTLNNFRTLSALARFDMSSRKVRVRWCLLATAALLAHPVFAAGVDCSQTSDPVARTICAYPKLSALDSQLAVAYAAALVRDPSRANALKQDEVNWLGERDREIWWLLANQRQFPSLPSDLEAGLANAYQLRIAFLHDIDNPHATRGMPIAQTLLHAAATLPARATDPLQALEATGTLVLPREQYAADPERTITKMAAPPDAALRAALDRFGPLYEGRTVAYFPSMGFGGAFNVAGTAVCQSWVMFEKQGNVTVPVRGGDFLISCMRDGGSTGYLALIDGHPVALKVTNDQSSPNITDFQWRRWLGGSKWDPTRRIRFRYSYRLKLSRMDACPKASRECMATAGPALIAAQRYMRNALTLANPAGETGAQKARFRHLLQRASHRKEWGYCWYPVWFSARSRGKLTIGGITQSHIGCHPAGSSLDVAFWGTRNQGTQWWFSDHIIDVDRKTLLFAALIPPSNRRD